MLQVKGKTVVLTGTFTALQRRDAEARLAKKGARITGSVSRRTDLVFAGADAGSKRAAANALGIPVHGEAALFAVIGRARPARSQSAAKAVAIATKKQAASRPAAPSPTSAGSPARSVNPTIAAVRKELAPLARPCVFLVPSLLGDRQLAPWSSNLCGLPYAAKAAALPRRDGRPLFMVAQLNFAEMPALASFPAAGLLQFWLDDAYERSTVLWLPRPIEDKARLKTKEDYVREIAEVRNYDGFTTDRHRRHARLRRGLRAGVHAVARGRQEGGEAQLGHRARRRRQEAVRGSGEARRLHHRHGDVASARPASRPMRCRAGHRRRSRSLDHSGSAPRVQR